MDMDTFDQGIQITIIGFSVVILSLVILSLVMAGFSRLINPQAIKPESKGDSPDEKTEGDSQDTLSRSKEGSETTVDSQQEMHQAEDDISPQVVAAISAAVSFAMADSSDHGFRITSIRPVKGTEDSRWKFVGRQEQLQASNKH
ncbi:OadG family protein [Natranaerobius thermophilus]|uniref:Sodium pump decarboxylase gamma subunit n=2 Tax=Natranaerobius TaxID=375928 RepID=B2A3X1_NATTJ|nr:OadG family protein [Natranaerobius thermophilus]ACB85073.1 sodium pump decarboxylase gamma subunit [Natranaerobius thermophilus JW/NM-WN-LF]